MSVNEFVSITIQITNPGLTQEGFGTPLIPTYSAAWSGVRTYAQSSDILSDFASDTPEYILGNQLFSQSPRPAQVKIGKATHAPTMQYTVGAIAVNNSFPYKIQVDGTGVTSTEVLFTSDSTATAQEIHNGLVAALNAVVGKNYTAAFAPLTFTPETFTVADQPTGKLTIASHGLNTGDGPFQLTTSSSLPTGLSTLTNYWAIRFDANTIQLASSLANALAGTFIVLSSNGAGTNTVNGNTPLSPVLPFLITGNAAGNWFSIDIENPSLLSNKMSHSDVNITADLGAILLADSDWYWLVSTWNSKSVALATALWVEGNGKAWIVSVVDTDALNTSASNGDTLDALNGFGYKRTDGKYHNSPKQAFDAASTGRIAPLVPGKWTEAFKTLVGVQPVTLTPTQRTNLRARRSGTYTKEKGRSITWDGKVFNTVYGYLDIVVGVDWFSDAVQTAAFGVMVSLDKVAYTDEDIDQIAGAVRGVIRDAASDAHEVLDPGDPSSADPNGLPPSVTFPKVADIAPGTRALRKLPNGAIRGRFQGAVQEIDFNATLTF